MKAVFLDRDGVIIDNSSHYYIFRTEDVKFVDGIFDNLKLLSEKGFDFFVVSNQGGISKQEYTKKDVEKVHYFIEKELEKRGLTIKEWAFCPHHDSIEKCFCRKPSPLMIEKLLAKYQIDSDKSYLIGDSPRDIDAAEQAGIKGILIPANQNMFSHIKELS
ncbi:D-glycero-alpha-D-manno-heptose-1,7-bisphosphate 7-phosphatase [Sunxiuqinia sp. A32]|uniref:D-glycero-alpha-D-manno-heptose-1,7-bisphosphate 7-phosphatase n=1 Tax=Sunxiuqinia sp. A32 TaxID=3461496 RepID=UPI0040457404